MPFTAMPGTWPCAAVAVILIYMDDQDNEIVRDSLTGLNNRKTLSATFAEYSRKTGAAEDLDIFVIDLNDFKKINDTFGHPTGDEALVKTADILREAAENRKAVVARTGGDEFLVMGFFPGEDAPEAFRKDLKERFARFNREEGRPYRLDAEVGFAPYKPGAALSELIDEADEMLYR